MMPSWQRRGTAGRQATSAALRVLAALVAVLLATSSLGQIAHFLAVPHAICAEHGELVELSGEAAHGSEGHDDHAPGASEPGPVNGPAASSQPSASHDHCEILASAQRQVALPAAASAALVPAPPSVKLELGATARARETRSALSFAPKTSPPRARSS